MRTEMTVYFDHDEVNDRLHYRLIVESMGSSRWNTGTNKRRLKEEFSECDLPIIDSLYKKAYKWYMQGVPNEVVLNYSEYETWKRLKRYCIKNFTIYGGNR